ncbi:MAG: OmpA family protein, partial [Hyphomicrobiaceae bacterium]
AASAPAKTAEIAKPAAPAATPAASAPAKTAEVAKSVPAAPVVPPAVKTADAAKSPNAAEPAAAPPKGVTSYFGTTPPPPEAAAKMNPAYKPDPVPAPTKVTAASPVPAPAPAAAAAPSLPVPVSPKGVTSFFGVTPPAVEPAAKMNPDYKPATAAPIADAAPAAAQTTATLPEVAKLPEVKSAAPVAVPAKPIDAAPVKSVAVPATPIAPIQPGVTSYFGTTPAPAEKTAIPNPEYRPAPAPVKEPSLAQAALNAVTALITPTPPRPAGVTNYYGSAPANVEAPARPNPDYKPTAASTAASTAPATTTAATPPAAKSSATTATAATTPAAPANALVPDAATCATKVANAVKKGRIIFQSSRAELKGTSIATLDRLATAFKACPNAKLKVEGHTDSTGQPDANKKLSQARAQTVADYLATKGIDKARVAPVGVGSVRPVAPNTTALNKARNRRIEFAVENL